MGQDHEPSLEMVLIPFGDEPVNPAYLIATTLPGLIPATASCPVPIQITFYPYQIPASYEEIRSLVPRLNAAYDGNVDMILHMGMSPSRGYYSIERLAHRDNYNSHADVFGDRLDKEDGSKYWPDCPPVLETSLNFGDIFQQWRRNLLETPGTSSEKLDGVVLRPSQDAGHFVCDFIYYSSLAEKHRKKKERGGPNRIDDRPVMFFHVPHWSGDHDLNKGRLVTVGLLRALAQSWTAAKSAERLLHNVAPAYNTTPATRRVPVSLGDDEEMAPAPRA